LRRVADAVVSAAGLAEDASVEFNRVVTGGIAIIGFGAIGHVVASEIDVAAVLVRDRYLESTRRALPGVDVVTSIGDLLATGPDVVAECAGQPAVREYGEAVLDGGTDLMVVSTGAFGDQVFLDRMCHAARGAGRGILVPAGATAGLDGLMALREGGLDRVRYTSSKPPHAWLGTPAERAFRLDALTQPTVIHSGPAHEAARLYPKNANLAVTIALAGLGLERTQVDLVADPALTTGNIGRIEASGRLGTLTVEMAGRAAPDNPKTSQVTAYSIVHALRSGRAVMALP
jgi:aspartate dehydrogenase